MTYIFVAHGFEEIEMITVLDILRRGDVDVKSVGIASKTVTGAHGITVHCDMSDRELSLSKIDAIVLPGGMPGTTNLMKSKTVDSAIDYCIENNKYIAAICAAPMILAKKGLLSGKKATISASYSDELIDADYLSDQKVVIDGKIITAQSPSSAMEFSLELLSCLKNKDISIQIEESL